FLEQNHIAKNFFNCIISSVVSTHTMVLKEAVGKLSAKSANAIFVLDHQMDTGLDLKIKAPEELGTDRLANAAGAYALYGGPVAVIDFGTATTITAVGKNADFIGGSIMAGIGLMNEVLAQRTSKLAKVALEPQGPALGTDTAGCIRSGLLIGTAGAVERILEEIENEAGYTFRTVITGGHAQLVARFLKRPHELNLFLTLEGLRIIYAKNRSA
ncbi:MAG: type III pantothenate kinase, partial [Nitrospirota bacterium]|nr:type III pantothenate kinase [Nitrospirota bacterium]